MRKLFFLLLLVSGYNLVVIANDFNRQIINIPIQIMGEGQLAPQQLYAIFATALGSDAQRAERLAAIYIEEAAAEGVNHDVAFAQMILETGYLRFAGVVRPYMNNFCGLGAVSATKNGHTFPDERSGVRAHIQHLKAYASTDSLRTPLADPRYHFVSPRGKAPTVDGLAGTWAQDPQYAVKLKSVLHRMYSYAL
ncbi:MAG: glucosaminidase domain-containing protein [Prevotellaceae bacterium]|nr:glucosaminidase domain-containing protein [Prevotellaceae bacterium]